jgi:hypothetical protein
MRVAKLGGAAALPGKKSLIGGTLWWWRIAFEQCDPKTLAR